MQHSQRHVWYTGIARLPNMEKQRAPLLDAAANNPTTLSPFTAPMLRAMVPGALPKHVDNTAAAGLLLRDGVVLHPERYMRCGFFVHHPITVRIIVVTQCAMAGVLAACCE